MAEGGGGSSMKRAMILTGLAVLGVACLLNTFLGCCQPILALSSRNLEMVFLITDSNTGKPVSGASLHLEIVEDRGDGTAPRVVKLVTNDRGMAVFHRPDNWCDELIRPFCKTMVHHDLTWASLRVTAKGYRKVDHLDLHTFPFEDKGSPGKGEPHRLEFPLTLSRVDSK
jgi:hypothetical protein